ncbi:MAG: TfoX family protein [Alphaproteobacteria bacterium]|nr:MAG: TfoX family protein [Alphaproteobacteria bacterium]
MAYDEGMAQTLREALEGLPGISEKKMFGGLCFLMNGNMVCGVHGGSRHEPVPGCMFRVGPERMEQALAIPGTATMAFTGRPMKGMVEANAAVLADDARRGALVGLAVAFASSLPPK